jgi:3'-5' exoribonuclease 1
MHYIVLDLEATCWENRDQQPNESIEIGAVAINSAKEIVSEIDLFVRPSVYPQLSDFCIQLTSISQSKIDRAPLFTEVFVTFKEWLNSFGDDYVLCSWGHYDRTQLLNDCTMHQLDTDWLNKHISLKHQYATIKKLRRPIGMKGALNMEKMELDGTHHRGIDDAKNIAKIFIQYFDQWDFSPSN